MKCFVLIVGLCWGDSAAQLNSMLSGRKRPQASKFASDGASRGDKASVLPAAYRGWRYSAHPVAASLGRGPIMAARS